MKRFLISGVLFSIIFGISAIAVTAQLPGLERIRRQRERAIQAEQQREEDKRREEAGLAPKRPKPAVMNVDVQAVLAKAEYKDFNEAKANAVTKIADGEPLWLYVKFVKGKLGDYVLTVPTDQPDVSRSLLYAEIGPQGDATTQYQYTLQFTKDDLALTELKLNLAPGISGRGRSMPLFLSAAAASRPGVWNNELRLTNTTAIPRGADQNLTKNVITFSFAGSLVKYPQMAEDYESIMLRGTADKTRLPIGSGFYDAAIKEQVEAKLRSSGINYDKVFFAGGDTWAEYASAANGMKQTRRIHAVYTTRDGENCGYGLVEITQTFEAFDNKWTMPSLIVEKQQPLPCAQLP